MATHAYRNPNQDRCCPSACEKWLQMGEKNGHLLKPGSQALSEKISLASRRPELPSMGSSLKSLYPAPKAAILPVRQLERGPLLGRRRRRGGRFRHGDSLDRHSRIALSNGDRSKHDGFGESDTHGCVQSQAATAGALLELRPLANACLCEALGRQTRGSFDFCGPAEEQHSWTCDCTPRRPSTVPANASSRSWTSAAAAGRGPSDAVPAAPSGRLVLIGQVQQAVRRRTPAASCRLARPLRVAQTPSPGPPGAKIRQKCGTIPFRFNSQMI